MSSDLQQRIVDSQILTNAELQQAISQSPAAASDPQALLELLKEQGRLTEFEADALAAGFTGPFQIGPYAVHHRVAAGLLGDVFRAVHVDFQQPVSLKVFSAALAKDPEKLARMQRELRISVQVDHPHVLRSFHLGRVGDLTYLAFEDLDGESLETRLNRLGRLPYGEACRLLKQAALGVESLHGSEIVHRDLRPATMWIRESEQLKLMEFGAARDAFAFLDQLEGGRELTLSGTQLGDLRYRAPEAVADARMGGEAADVYSLGCILYHALVGEPPFTHKHPIKLAEAHLSESPTSVSVQIPEIPRELADLVARALAKGAEDRPTVADFDWGLSRWVSDTGLDVAAADQTWNPEYVAWIREQFAQEPAPGATDGVSDDAADFFHWLTENAGARR